MLRLEHKKNKNATSPLLTDGTKGSPHRSSSVRGDSPRQWPTGLRLRSRQVSWRKALKQRAISFLASDPGRARSTIARAGRAAMVRAD